MQGSALHNMEALSVEKVFKISDVAKLLAINTQGEWKANLRPDAQFSSKKKLLHIYESGFRVNNFSNILFVSAKWHDFKLS